MKKSGKKVVIRRILRCFLGGYEKSGKSLKIVELKGDLGYNVSAFEALLLE